MMKIACGPRAWLVAVGFAVVLGFAYANALNAAFVFDDEPAIVNNVSIRRLGDLGTVLTPDTGMGSTQDGRPLYNLSLALNYAVHGLWRPGYRIGNLLIHLVSCCLLFDIVRRIVVLARPDGGDASPQAISWLAAAAAMIWAVHPLHTHVITYAAQRAEALAAMFILAAFDAAILALDRGSFPAAAVAAACGVAGGLSKETTAAILPLVAAFDWAFRNRLAAGGAADHGRRLRISLYAGLALNLATLAAVRLVIGGRGDTAGFATAPLDAHLLTQARGLWIYLEKILWPHPLVLDHGYGLVTRAADVWPQVVATFVAAAVILVGFVLRPRAFFPLVAAAILLSPSSAVPVAMQTIAEHRVYLASSAIVALVVAGLGAWLAARGAANLVVAVCICVVIACVCRTIVRNRDFATATSLWAQNVRDCPENPRGLKNLVGLLIRDGERYDLAEAAYRGALAQPLLAEQAAAGLGDVYRQTGRLAEAQRAYSSVVGASPRLSLPRLTALVGLGTTLVRLQSPQEALERLAVALDPRWDQVRMPPDDRWKLVGRGRAAWAAACRAVGDDAVATESMSAAKAVAAEHGVAEALARACDELGEFATAAQLWEPLAAADPALLANLAVSRMQAGQPEAALAAFEEAVRRFPDDPGMRANLDRARQLIRSSSPSP